MIKSGQFVDQYYSHVYVEEIALDVEYTCIFNENNLRQSHKFV